MPSQILPITVTSSKGGVAALDHSALHAIHTLPSHSSHGGVTATTTTTTTMLLKGKGLPQQDDPSASLLISSYTPSSSSPFDDTNAMMPPKQPLTRASSFTNSNSNSNANANSNSNKGSSIGSSSCFFNQKRRRRAASEDSLSLISNGGNGADAGGGGSRASSFGNDVRRVASETFLLTRLGLNILSYLGVGYRWISKFIALGCYAVLLLPGFIQVGYAYFFSSQIRRSIVYGDKPRNRLDLYLPKNQDGPKPVVAFITGGAWVIGYKAWGSLLGQQLSERDIIVACIDYRNFPQGTMSDMIADASQGISFVCNNIAEYGGDPNRIYLMGQSAGAHIAACALVEQAIKEAGEGEGISWSLSQIKAYFGLSGVYNLPSVIDHFHQRGLYRSMFLRMMEGEESLRRFSPELMVQDPNMANAVSLLPHIVLFHGTGDYTIPSDASKSFAETLKRLGVKAESILYEGKTHTDVFLQDPMRGGKDDMFEDLVGYIHSDDPEARARDAAAPPRRRLVPEFMLKLAHNVSPF